MGRRKKTKAEEEAEAKAKAENENASQLEKLKQFLADINKTPEELERRKRDEEDPLISDASDEPTDYESPGTPPKVPTPEGLSEDEYYKIYRQRRIDAAQRLQRRARRAAKKKIRKTTIECLEWQLGFSDNFCELAASRLNSPILRHYKKSKIRKCEAFLIQDVELLRKPRLEVKNAFPKTFNMEMTWNDLHEIVLELTKPKETEEQKKKRQGVMGPKGLTTMDDFLDGAVAEEPTTDEEELAKRKQALKEKAERQAELAKKRLDLEKERQSTTSAPAGGGQHGGLQQGSASGSTSRAGTGSRGAANKLRQAVGQKLFTIRKFSAGGRVATPLPGLGPQAASGPLGADMNTIRSPVEHQDSTAGIDDKQAKEEREHLKTAVFGASAVKKKKTYKALASAKRRVAKITKTKNGEEQTPSVVTGASEVEGDMLSVRDVDALVGGTESSSHPHQQSRALIDEGAEAGDESDDSRDEEEDESDYEGSLEQDGGQGMLTADHPPRPASKKMGRRHRQIEHDLAEAVHLGGEIARKLEGEDQRDDEALLASGTTTAKVVVPSLDLGKVAAATTVGATDAVVPRAVDEAEQEGGPAAQKELSPAEKKKARKEEKAAKAKAQRELRAAERESTRAAVVDAGEDNYTKAKVEPTLTSIGEQPEHQEEMKSGSYQPQGDEQDDSGTSSPSAKINPTLSFYEQMKLEREQADRQAAEDEARARAAAAAAHSRKKKDFSSGAAAAAEQMEQERLVNAKIAEEQRVENDKKKRQAEVEAAQQRIFEVEERHRIAVERETKRKELIRLEEEKILAEERRLAAEIRFEQEELAKEEARRKKYEEEMNYEWSRMLLNDFDFDRACLAAEKRAAFEAQMRAEAENQRRIAEERARIEEETKKEKARLEKMREEAKKAEVERQQAARWEKREAVEREMARQSQLLLESVRGKPEPEEERTPRELQDILEGKEVSITPRDVYGEVKIEVDHVEGTKDKSVVAEDGELVPQDGSGSRPASSSQGSDKKRPRSRQSSSRPSTRSSNKTTSSRRSAAGLGAEGVGGLLGTGGEEVGVPASATGGTFVPQEQPGGTEQEVVPSEQTRASTSASAPPRDGLLAGTTSGDPISASAFAQDQHIRVESRTTEDQHSMPGLLPSASTQEQQVLHEEQLQADDTRTVTDSVLSARGLDTATITSTPRMPSARDGRHVMEKDSSVPGSSAVSMSESETVLRGKAAGTPREPTAFAGAGTSSADSDSVAHQSATESEGGAGKTKKAKRTPRLSAKHAPIPEEMTAQLDQDAEEAATKARLMKEQLMEKRRREAEENGLPPPREEDLDFDALDEEEEDEEGLDTDIEDREFVDFHDWTPKSSMFDTESEEDFQQDRADLQVINDKEVKKAREAEDRAERMGKTVERMETPRTPEPVEIDVLNFDLEFGTAKPGTELRLKVAERKQDRLERKTTANIRKSVSMKYEKDRYEEYKPEDPSTKKSDMFGSPTAEIKGWLKVQKMFKFMVELKHKVEELRLERMTPDQVHASDEKGKYFNFFQPVPFQLPEDIQYRITSTGEKRRVKLPEEKIRLRQISACNADERLRYVMKKPDAISWISMVYECTFAFSFEKTMMQEVDRAMQRMNLERERLEELHMKWLTLLIKSKFENGEKSPMTKELQKMVDHLREKHESWRPEESLERNFRDGVRFIQGVRDDPELWRILIKHRSFTDEELEVDYLFPDRLVVEILDPLRVTPAKYQMLISTSMYNGKFFMKEEEAKQQIVYQLRPEPLSTVLAGYAVRKYKSEDDLRRERMVKQRRRNQRKVDHDFQNQLRLQEGLDMLPTPLNTPSEPDVQPEEGPQMISMQLPGVQKEVMIEVEDENKIVEPGGGGEAAT